MQLLILAAVVLILTYDGNGEATKTSDLIRTTEYGLIKGFKTHSGADPNVEFYSFKGVPYAQPPLDNLRFQEPLPSTKWSGIKEATKPAQRCTQISENFMGKDVIGSEDCLYLEVFEPITSRNNTQGLLPVMVWFHGGTFIFGTVNSTGPDYFMEKPIILITVEYRVNVFGFLSVRDDPAKGNCGLKDQSFALRWVKHNIRNFGGDPNMVTIFGESAGGASVQYHMLSSWSKGLFHRAISQSGSPLNRWAHQEYPEVMTNRLARGLGINSTSNEVLVKELQKVDYRVLMKAAFDSSIVGFYTPYYAQPFGPSIENKSDTAFISESAFELLRKGRYAKVPYLMGYNTEEGSFGYDYIDNGRVDINIYKENPSLIIPISMNVPQGSKCEQKALDQIRRFYFDNGVLTDKVNWINYMNYELFTRGVMKSMDFMYKDIPLYFYRISYAGSRQNSYLGGVGHFEEVKYLLYPRREDWSPVESESDKRTRKRMVTLWSNFATTGNPTPNTDELLQNITWPEAYPNKAFLDIGTNLTLFEKPEQAHFEFWEKLFNDCGYPPYHTY